MSRKNHEGSRIYQRLYHRCQKRGINRGLKQGSEELRLFIRECIGEQKAQGRTANLLRQKREEKIKQLQDPILKKCCLLLMNSRGVIRKRELKRCVDEEVFHVVNECLRHKKEIPSYVRKYIDPVNVTNYGDSTLQDFFGSETKSKKAEFDAWMKKRGNSASYTQIMAKLKEIEQNEYS